MKKSIFFIILFLSVFFNYGQLTNGNFQNGTSGGDAFRQGMVPNWTQSHGSPSLSGGTQFAWMWSYDMLNDGVPNGEGILANFNFVQGQSYQISYSIRTRDYGITTIRNNAMVNILAANGVQSTNASAPVPTATSSQGISINGFTAFQDNVWTNVNVCFTADNNYSQFWIYPLMTIGAQQGRQAEMSIDNITITPIIINPTITANGEDISQSLTATIKCFTRCITINVSDPNLSNIVYNTTAPILNDSSGLFCLPSDNALTDFTVNITATDSCGNPYNQTVLVKIEQGCCPEKPHAEPYWSHPDCPKVVCEAEKWPVVVLDENNVPINGSGVTITWVNTDPNPLPNMSGTWNYVGPNQHWEITITYENGCVYTIQYFEDCCTDDVFIKMVECPPTQTEIGLIERYLATNRKRISSEKYKLIAEGLAKLKAIEPNKNCDPCDLGYGLVYLVDSAGNLIDPSIYDSIVWSNGDTGPMSIVKPNIPLSVVATQNKNGYQCIYEDTFTLVCRTCSVTAPINLQSSSSTLSWDPVPGAVSYIISSPSEIRIECKCKWGVSIVPITTTNTSYVLPTGLQSKCFVWQVKAVCRDGSTSPVSTQMCHTRKLPAHEQRGKVSIHPNPNNGLMEINIQTETDSDVLLKIYRFDGILVETIKGIKTINGVLNLNLDVRSKLPKGLYFFTFTTNKETITKRIIIK